MAEENRQLASHEVHNHRQALASFDTPEQQPRRASTGKGVSFCAAKPSSVGGGSFSGSSDGNACAKRSMTAPGGRAIEHKFDDVQGMAFT